MRRWAYRLTCSMAAAVEHGPRLVAGHRHGHALAHARAQHVPRRGPAQVVEEPVMDSKGPSGSQINPPRLGPLFDHLIRPLQERRPDRETEGADD